MQVLLLPPPPPPVDYHSNHLEHSVNQLRINPFQSFFLILLFLIFLKFSIFSASFFLPFSLRTGAVSNIKTTIILIKLQSIIINY